jgi:hypothetical protein
MQMTTALLIVNPCDNKNELKIILDDSKVTLNPAAC